MEGRKGWRLVTGGGDDDSNDDDDDDDDSDDGDAVDSVDPVAALVECIGRSAFFV